MASIADSVGKKRLVGKMELRGVLLAQRGVGFGDADELDLGVRRQVMQEAPDVVVNQADDGDADSERDSAPGAGRA